MFKTYFYRVKEKLLYRIAVTGPESTGKTTLAGALAEHFGTVWVPEFSRTYLDNLGRHYVYEDLEHIARGQADEEDRYAAKARGFLFCDTDMLVMKVWSEYRYGKCHPFILDALAGRRYDLFVLCGTDVPWEFDPLRENPNEREELYQIYRAELILLEADFIEVAGGPQERLLQVAKLLSLKF